jgi:enediyne biosynthesis protein E4
MISTSWTPRRVLGAAPAVLASTYLEEALATDVSIGKNSVPYSRFVDVAAAAGLTATMFYGEATHATYVTEIMGAGCAFFDYDNDGWMDIFILGGRRLESIPAGASNRLYKNNRDGTFTDFTAKSGLFDAGWATGVCVGDYNNGGHEDLFVTYYGRCIATMATAPSRM